MTVIEHPVETWRGLKLKFKRNRYPVSLNRDLPSMYFVSLWVGSRGSGKTYAIAQLLKQYEKCGLVDYETGHKVAQRIVLFSPTADSNPIFTALKNLHDNDIITSYSDSKLVDVIDDVKLNKQETIDYQRKMKLYHKFLRVKRIDELTPDELFELEVMNFEPPEEPKYPHGCVTFFVLDDLVGSAAFKSTGKSALTNLVLRNRHLGINIMIATQNLKAVPKSIRTNTSLFVIFRFASKKIIVEDLYSEVSNLMTIEDFEDIFDYATKEEHSALVIDFSQPKERRLKMNFEKILRVE